MVRVGHAVLAAAMMAAMGKPVAAEVLDTTYRGTMVCDKLPFTSQQTREAIEVTISGGAVRYNHVVRLRNAAVEATAEQGTGTIDGQKINLQGSWKSGSRQYEATYSGSFVRRSAKLKGTQTWTDGGKTAIRACAGAIKRPLKPFLPRGKKQAAARSRIEAEGVIRRWLPMPRQLHELEPRGITSHTRTIARTPVPITSQSEACLPVSE